MLTGMTEKDWEIVLAAFEAARPRRGDKGRDDRKFLTWPRLARDDARLQAASGAVPRQPDQGVRVVKPVGASVWIPAFDSRTL